MPKQTSETSTHKQFGDDLRREDATYARFSTGKQREASIEGQVRDLREASNQVKGFIPDENIFADRGFRGHTQNRPALNRLMDLIRSGRNRFKDVWIWDTSRLSRELSARLRKFFECYGVTLHFLKDGMTSGSKAFDLQHTFKSYMDENESGQLGDRVSRGAIECVSKGQHPAGKCYGYWKRPIHDPHCLDPHRPGYVKGFEQEIILEEARIIRMIFSLYAGAEGGYAKIAQILNDRGIPSPGKAYRYSSSGWTHSTVKHILDNQRYRGVVVYRKTATVRDPETRQIKHRKRPESEWITQEVPSLRIISEELWEAVRRRRELVRDRMGSSKLGGLHKSKASKRYIFSGLLRCGLCGAGMILTNGANGSYKCQSFVRKFGCSNGQLVRRASFQDSLLNLIAATACSSVTFEQLKAAFKEELSRQRSQQLETALLASSQEGPLRDEKRALEGGLQNLAEELATHGGSETLRGLLAVKEARLRTVVEILEQLQTPPAEVDDESIDAFLKRALADLSGVLQLEPEHLRGELQKTIQAITLTPVTVGGVNGVRIGGDIGLFTSADVVMLNDTEPRLVKHHCSVSLTGSVMTLDDRFEVGEILSRPAPICEVSEPYPLAA